MKHVKDYKQLMDEVKRDYFGKEIVFRSELEGEPDESFIMSYHVMNTDFNAYVLKKTIKQALEEKQYALQQSSK